MVRALIPFFASIYLLAHAADPFAAGAAKLRQRISPDPAPTNSWRPNFRLLFGVDSAEGTKHDICFVELTTTKPPVTNTNGKAWAPVLETNGFSWTSTNKPPVTKNIRFVWSLYPVQVRIFDATGRKTKEGTTTVPFGLLTNGLVEVCRLGLQAKGTPADTESNVKAFCSGFLWLGTMMQRLQSVPAVQDVWDKANNCFRWPSLWTMTKAALGKSVMIDLQPDYKKIAIVSTNGPAHYSLPIELVCSGRVLTRVETVVGPAIGAAALMGGVESVQATHPTKPDHKFTARVLAAGIAVD